MQPQQAGHPSSFAGSMFSSTAGASSAGGFGPGVHRQGHNGAVSGGRAGLNILRHDLAAAVPAELHIQVGCAEHLLGKGAGLAGHIGDCGHCVLIGGSVQIDGRACGDHAAAHRVLVDDGAAARADELVLETETVQGDLCIRPSVLQTGLHLYGTGRVVGGVLLDAQIGCDLADDVAYDRCHDLTGIVIEPTRVVQQNEHLDLRIIDGQYSGKAHHLIIIAVTAQVAVGALCRAGLAADAVARHIGVGAGVVVPFPWVTLFSIMESSWRLTSSEMT